ncbi:MAG: hypothetical protein IPL79_04350 [Myxococcales bacterium]|nr:hypothetical protein [Myxococcales bacterium]
MNDLQLFLLTSLRIARDEGFLTAADILRHITPEVMAAHLPRAIWAKLLGALVTGGKADAEAVMGAIDLDTIVTHMPTEISAAMLLDVGGAQFGTAGAHSVPAATWGAATSSSKAGPTEATVAVPAVRPSQAAEAAARGPVVARPSAQWSRVSAPNPTAAAMSAPSVVPGRRPQSAATVRAKPPTIEPKPAMADVELDLGEERLDAAELIDWNPTSEATASFDEKRKR